MNNCSFRWKIYRLSLFFKEYVSIKNEFVEKMVFVDGDIHFGYRTFLEKNCSPICHLEGNKE